MLLVLFFGVTYPSYRLTLPVSFLNDLNFYLLSLCRIIFYRRVRLVFSFSSDPLFFLFLNSWVPCCCFLDWKHSSLRGFLLSFSHPVFSRVYWLSTFTPFYVFGCLSFFKVVFGFLWMGFCVVSVYRLFISVSFFRELSSPSLYWGIDVSFFVKITVT